MRLTKLILLDTVSISSERTAGLAVTEIAEITTATKVDLRRLESMLRQGDASKRGVTCLVRLGQVD